MITKAVQEYKMKPIKVEVNDKMQQDYIYYRTEPVGKNFQLIGLKMPNYVP
jgi:hypothetical protein